MDTPKIALGLTVFVGAAPDFPEGENEAAPAVVLRVWYRTAFSSLRRTRRFTESFVGALADLVSSACRMRICVCRRWAAGRQDDDSYPGLATGIKWAGGHTGS